MSVLRLSGLLAALAVLAGPSGADAATPRSDPFAVELYARLRRQDGNLFVSPASLADAFRLALPGAAGPTADEMRRVFHFDTSTPAPRFGADAGAGVRSSVNAIWLADNLVVRPSYIDAISQQASAAVNRADFEGDIEGSRARINAWAAAATQNRINDVVPPGALKEKTRVVITNAVYFRAPWATPFPAEATQPADFYAAGVERVSVPMMHLSVQRPYFKGAGFQVVELPFEENATSMIVVLPDSRSGLPAVEASATPGAVAGWLAQLDGIPRQVDLRLPRFSFSARIQPKAELQAMGLRLAFTDHADFTRLSAEHLKIDEVLHHAFIKVDETGAEAAASTALVLVPTSGRLGPPPAVFRADHPFLFLIRDNHSGAILFMGRVSDPR